MPDGMLVLDIPLFLLRPPKIPMTEILTESSPGVTRHPRVRTVLIRSRRPIDAPQNDLVAALGLALPHAWARRRPWSRGAGLRPAHHHPDPVQPGGECPRRSLHRLRHRVFRRDHAVDVPRRSIQRVGGHLLRADE